MPFSPKLAFAPDPDVDDKAARKARKAARRAAEAKAVVVEAEAKCADPHADGDEKAARKARKAARLAAQAKAAEEEAEAKSADPDADDDKAARKARKAARRAAETQATAAEEEAAAKSGCKAGEESLGKRKAASDNVRNSTDAKTRRLEEGKVATKELGTAAFRKLHEIIVNGACPAPLETFDAAADSFGGELSKALLAQGYTSPSPIQAQAWPLALTGHDVVAVAKTGSGKTCGFLLPALARIGQRGPAPVPQRWGWSSSEPARPSVLVVAPTRELALQIGSEAEKFAPCVKARVVVLYGGSPKGPQVGECRKGVDVLVGTPGRLNDLCEGNSSRGLSAPISLEAVTYLVLDEADQMLDMGFEKDIRKIVDRCPATGAPEEGGGADGVSANTKRQTLFFTATWPKKVEAAAASLTSKASFQIRIGQGAGGDKLSLNKSVTQEIIVTEWKQKIWKLKDYLKSSLGQSESVVVFAATKGGCDFLEKSIKEACQGTWCRAIHGDKEQWQREETLGQFRANVAGGKQAVLVATDVASRGLDIPGISLVVIYDFSCPQQPAGIAVESFVHRVGRTGRGGKTGRALTFWTSDDRGAPAFVKLLEDAGQKVPKELKDIAAWERPAQSRGKGKGKGQGKGKRSW
eukprot:TRINITY_DN47882_c0_g1_i1.p1 TRINITY_DN47882_c0_g1~~TRINITY_DN47882_c0_g1_i1.p1  ORF type:complete len:637 (-),score=154.13 TRINITY_DN47882_c0_g1_i1:1-1911(-)